MRIKQMIEKQDERCARCTGKCKGCDCKDIVKIMDAAEAAELTDEERRLYYAWMKG